MSRLQVVLKTVIQLSLLALVGCVNHSHDFVQSQIQNNLLAEDWQNQVDTNPTKWKKQADNWLWFGTPTAIERADRNAPFSDAMTTMMVKVPDFTQVKVDGDFQVELDGRFQHNSVYLLGPNEEIRQVSVEVKDHTLEVHLLDKDKDPKHVIVRIAIHNLQGLVQNGSCKVEGRFIRANPLSITALGSGPIILTGKLNVKHIDQAGSGDITILGAYTPFLKINSSGRGAINISGRVGVESIEQSGSGDINIIGADTNALSIWATGSGKLGIQGIANVKQITAAGHAGVYLYLAKSKDIYIYTRDNARVGLVGQTKTLYIDAKGSSTFAGRYLHSQYTYVRSREWAHVNAMADNRAFIAADENSSVYVIGWPQVISPYVTDNAVVIPIEPPPLSPTQELRYEKRRAKRFGSETYVP